MRSAIADALAHGMAGLALVAGIFWFAAPGWGDDAAVEGVGGAMHAMRGHPSVVMESETVDVVISPKGADVKCLFLFRNDGPATTVKMGFPEQGYGDIDFEHPTGFLSFRSWVDGREVPTKVEGYHSDLPEGTRWTRWRTKVLNFEARQTRQVEVQYRDKLGKTSDGSAFFEYIFTTGASWKGKIGHAKLTIRFKDVKGYSTEDGGILDGSRMVREWRDFEPRDELTDDFTISFFPAAPPLVLNGERVPYDLRTAPLPQMRLGELLVPAVWLAKQIGGNLTWDPEQGTAILKRVDRTVLLSADRVWHSRLVVSVSDVMKELAGTARLEHNPERFVATLNP